MRRAISELERPVLSIRRIRRTLVAETVALVDVTGLLVGMFVNLF